PAFVTASRAAGDFSPSIGNDGACTSKRMVSPDGRLSCTAPRSGSGAADRVSSWVGKEVSSSIVLFKGGPDLAFGAANRQSAPAACLGDGEYPDARGLPSGPYLKMNPPEVK